MNYESISPLEAAALISTGACRVFDVRTPPEFASHRIKGAHLLPIQELNARHPEIPWREIRGFRNIVVHAYVDRLDPELVWTYVVENVDALGKMASAEPWNQRGPRRIWAGTGVT